MNRLILIGNGFDLAHNLKTSYKDFIENLWTGIFMEIVGEAKKQGVNIIFDFIDKNELISDMSCKLISIKGDDDFVIEIINTQTNCSYIFDNDIFKFKINLNSLIRNI